MPCQLLALIFSSAKNGKLTIRNLPDQNINKVIQSVSHLRICTFSNFGAPWFSSVLKKGQIDFIYLYNLASSSLRFQFLQCFHDFFIKIDPPWVKYPHSISSEGQKSQNQHHRGRDDGLEFMYNLCKSKSIIVNNNVEMKRYLHYFELD